MNIHEPAVHPLLVDVPTACVMLSVKKTKLFGLLREGRLERVKLGGKSLVTTRSIEALAKASIPLEQQPLEDQPEELSPPSLIGVMIRGDL